MYHSFLKCDRIRKPQLCRTGGDFLRIAIVDDLALDRQRLAEDISRWTDEQHLPFDSLPDQFGSGEEFLKDFSAGKYDIIFLDIYMNGMNGMETARQIRETDASCRLIFTTTTSDFAVDSYEVDSSWYLVKPYSYEKLSDALARCDAFWKEQNQFLLVPGKKGDEKLPLHQIAWTEYVNRKIRVHFKNGQETQVYMRQKDFCELLLLYPYFCDCMKGLIVNFEAVKKLADDCFLLESGEKIPISRLKYKSVREKYLEYAYAQARAE